MIVHIKLSFSLRFYATAIEKHLKGDKLNVREKATIEEVLRILGIPDHNDKLYFINDVQVGPDQILQDGDVLHIASAIAGG